MSYFNEEQLDHMRDLQRLGAEGKICPCGWYTKDECARKCQSPYGSPEAHRAALAKAGAA